MCVDIPSENDDKEIERYSDRKRKTHSKREALASYLILTPANFPVELVQGNLDFFFCISVHIKFICYVVAAEYSLGILFLFRF